MVFNKIAQKRSSALFLCKQKFTKGAKRKQNFTKNRVYKESKFTYILLVKFKRLMNMTMKMFLEELSTAVRNVAVENNLNVDSFRIENDQLTLNIRTDNGTRHCINTHRFIFWPCDKHEMMIEEIWIGYDEGGYPWSDHMGGLTVDCNGLKTKGAIEKLAEKFIKKAMK